MKVHITNLYGQACSSTAQKAQNAVADIAKELDYKELGIYCYNMNSDAPQMLSTRLDGIIASVAFGDIVIFQLPTWNGIKFDEALIGRLSCYARLKKIFFVHDIPPLMSENKSSLSSYISLYNRADLLILPSQNMLDFLRSEGLTVKKVVIQRMWDFPAQIDSSVTPKFKKAINFAADVTQNRRPFVENWNYKGVELYVTAAERKSWAEGRNIRFLGWFNNDNLLANAIRKNGGFGLLWQDTPWWREYMKLNASYKLSAYLAAGIPVIIPSDISEKETIIHKNLGIAVESLDEAVDKVENMSEDQYRKMVENVDAFSCLIREGYFTKKLLTDAVFKLLYD